MDPSDGGDDVVREKAQMRRGRRLLSSVVLVAATLAGCVSSGSGARPPSGTGQAGGNGNVPTYTP